MDRNRSQFVRKCWLRLAGHPVTILPTMGGATALLLGWAVGAPAVVFGGIAGLGIAVGALVTRGLLVGGKIAEEVHAELRTKAHDATEAALDELRKKLASDNDTRDERMLDQLREFARMFKKDTGWIERINRVSAAEITSGVEELVRTCVQKLDDAFKIRKTADDMSISPVRDVLKQQREVILAEVATSIQELTELLTGVFTLGTGRDVSADTSRVRGRLKQALTIAKRVDERMNPHATDQSRVAE
ncbi:MAG: hypothetical protein Q7R80_02220 [bacterium]|nr:hypothetical protein [bacterium]